MDGGRWQFDHDGWSEVWHAAPGAGFDRVSVGGRVFSVAQDDLSALRPRTGDGCPVCRSALPQAFAHCPACGVPLAASGPAEPCQSVPNAGQPQAGLPPLSLAGNVQREPVRLPEMGRQFAFAVAGDPARLFALDRDGGWLHEFDRRRTLWTRLAGVGEIPLRGRSWGMAASPAGLVVASQGRLTVIDLAHGPLPRSAVTRLGDGESCIGAPCVMAGKAVAVVVRAGAVQLARRPLAPGGTWSFEPVGGAPSSNAARLLDDALSAPMATETQASWAGQDGTVVVSLAEDGSVGQAVWRGWGSGFAPYLQHRPYVDPDGGVWQLGSLPIPGKRGLGFERVRPQQNDQERIGGSVLASGILACRLLTLRRRAWVEASPYDRHLPGNDGDYLVPVLALDRERCVLVAAADGLTELVHAGPDGLGTPVLAGLRFYDGGRLHDLGLPIALRTLSQVSAFVFAGALYAYDAQENECWRWRLQAAD